MASCRSSKNLSFMNNLQDNKPFSNQLFSLDDYKLNQGDNLYIQIKTIDEKINLLFNSGGGSGSSAGTAQEYGTLPAQYVNGYLIDKQGNVDLPIIGMVKLEGLTLPEAKQAIEQKAKVYFKQFSLSVKLLSYKYTIIGEVNKPGVYYNYNNQCTLFDAISQASGITNYANLGKVQIVRKKGDQSRTMSIDLRNASVLTSPAYYVEPGDLIYIRPVRLKRTKVDASIFSLALSSISTLIILLKFIGD